jgi:RNA polymerase sigma-70 factor (ECF subfamily)
LVEAYIDAWARGDVEAVAGLLAEDVVFSMPPWASWWRGRDKVAGFAASAHEKCPESRGIPTRASGQPAIAYYQLDKATGRFKAAALDVLTFEGSKIKDITGFVVPDVFSRFGLPAELPESR